jgi:hypothetical protein
MDKHRILLSPFEDVAYDFYVPSGVCSLEFRSLETEKLVALLNVHVLVQRVEVFGGVLTVKSVSSN